MIMHETEIEELEEKLKDYAFYKAVFSDNQQEASYHYTEYTEAVNRGIVPNVVLREGKLKGVLYRVLAFSLNGVIPEDVRIRAARLVGELPEAVIERELTEPKGFTYVYQDEEEEEEECLSSLYQSFNGIYFAAVASEREEEICCPVTVYVADENELQIWPVAGKYIHIGYEKGDWEYEEGEPDLFGLFGSMMDQAIEAKYAQDPGMQQELKQRAKELMQSFEASKEPDDWAAMTFEEYREVLREVLSFPEPDPVRIRERDPYLIRFAVLLAAPAANVYGYSAEGLEPDAHTRAKEGRAWNYLKEAWGIENREDLINTLDWLFKSGQTEDYRLYYEAESPEDMISDDMDAQERKIAALEYTVVCEMKEVTDMNTMLAWDLGRAVMLTRWGCYTGLLTRKEAEQMLRDIALGIVSVFHSWGEYAAAYLFGALYWSYPDSTKAEASEYFIDLFHVIQNLLTAGEWSRIPWIEEVLEPNVPDIR